jgi:hypothetical protein
MFSNLGSIVDLFISYKDPETLQTSRTMQKHIVSTIVPNH